MVLVVSTAHAPLLRRFHLDGHDREDPRWARSRGPPGLQAASCGARRGTVSRPAHGTGPSRRIRAATDHRRPRHRPVSPASCVRRASRVPLDRAHRHGASSDAEPIAMVQAFRTRSTTESSGVARAVHDVDGRPCRDARTDHHQILTRAGRSSTVISCPGMPGAGSSDGSARPWPPTTRDPSRRRRGDRIRRPDAGRRHRPSADGQHPAARQGHVAAAGRADPDQGHPPHGPGADAWTTSSSPRPPVPRTTRSSRLARGEGWPVVRGSETDLLDRYLGRPERSDADVIVRVTSDCPLIDPDVIDRTVLAFQAATWTTPATRSSRGPIRAARRRGRARWLRSSGRVARIAIRPGESTRRHTSTGTRNRSGSCGSRPRTTMPTSAGRSTRRRTSRWSRGSTTALGRDDFGWREALAVVEAHPSWVSINRHVAQKVVPPAGERRERTPRGHPCRCVAWRSAPDTSSVRRTLAEGLMAAAGGRPS